MAHVTLPFENQPLLSIPSQPTGKYRWLIGSAVYFGGTVGAGTISVQNFIAGAMLNGGILGAGSLICAGACAYCIYRFVYALSTRSIEPIVPVFDESTFLALRATYNQINTLLNINLEETVDDTRLLNAIQQKMTQLVNIKPTRSESQDMKFQRIEKFIPSDTSSSHLRLRQIHNRLNALLNQATIIGPEQDIEEKRLLEFIDQQLTDLEKLPLSKGLSPIKSPEMKSVHNGLKDVHDRLNTLLEQESILDQEEDVDEVRCYEIIHLQLIELEEMLPKMRQDLNDFQELVEAGLGNKSMGSANTSALNSPSAESFDRGLFAKLDALAKKVARESSKNTSRYHSVYSSPITNDNKSSSVVSPIKKRVNPLDLNVNINVSDSDSDF